MRKALTLIAIVVVAIGCVPVSPAAADPLPPYVVAGRSADGFVYYNPVAATPTNGSLTMISADPLDRHNIVSVETGSDDQPWCVNFDAGECPLFWSRLVTALPASGGPTSEVQGLSAMTPLELYDFYCTLHTEMTGQLLALPPV